MTESSPSHCGLIETLLLNVGQWFRMPISWVLLIAIDLCLITLSSAQDQALPKPGPSTQVTTVEIEPPEDADDGIRFEAIDVFLNCGTNHLAAWQLEVQSKNSAVEIVGIEGGEHAAFAEPAYYDPKAMNSNRVILAAFSTANDLPSGKTRVARIHVQCSGRNVTEYSTVLSVAADSDGQRIPASLILTRAVQD